MQELVQNADENMNAKCDYSVVKTVLAYYI